MTFRFCDDLGPDGFGWIVEEAATRTSHALAADGKVWLVDALDWPDAIDRALELGEPAGVIQLLDRHNRDCAALAARFGVPHVVAPRQFPGSPFAFVDVRAAQALARVRSLVGRNTHAGGGGGARDESLLHRRDGADRRPPGAAAHARRRRSRRSSRSESSSDMARDRRRRTRRTGYARRCARAAAATGRPSSAYRSPAAARSPGRTSRGGATSPASFTGGFSGSASGAAPNDARTRSSGASP